MVFADLVGFQIDAVAEDTPLDGIEMLTVSSDLAKKHVYRVHGDYVQTSATGLYSADELTEFLIANVKTRPKRVRSKDE